LAIVAGMIKPNDHTEPTKVNYIVNIKSQIENPLRSEVIGHCGRDD